MGHGRRSFAERTFAMPPIHRATSRPRLAVCLGDAAFTAIVNEFRAAGIAAGEPTGSGPRASTTEVVQVELTDEHSVTTAVEALFDGVHVIAGASDRQLAADLFDQGRRLATAEWFDTTSTPLTVGLRPEHLELLLLIDAGTDVAGAAQRTSLSKRTAARRLAEARDGLGARSTVEAAAKLATRVDQLRSEAPTPQR